MYSVIVNNTQLFSIYSKYHYVREYEEGFVLPVAIKVLSCILAYLVKKLKCIVVARLH